MEHSNNENCFYLHVYQIRMITDTNGTRMLWRNAGSQLIPTSPEKEVMSRRCA